MEEIHVTVLEKNLVHLLGNLDPNTVIPFLIGDGVLRLGDYETLEALGTTEKKVSTLISVLTKRGKDAYTSFIRSLQEHDFNKHLADRLTSSEETEKDELRQNITGVEDKFFIPDDDDFQNDIASNGNDELTFDEFLKRLGLNEKFPCRLALSKYLSVKDHQLFQKNAYIVDLFWQRLSALDYRAQLNINSKPDTTNFSIQDMIFAVMHCSDCMLRQDILEKMSTCQLAVPIILSCIKSKETEFLNWSIGRIVKRWREETSLALEQYISTVPLFTVAFMRIGDIGGVSKSSILNNLLGQCQGNRKHSFFLSKEDCQYPRKFSSGNVEALWYTPVNSNGAEKIKWATTILNLRGDSSEYLPQVSFLCKAANLMVVFITAQNRNERRYMTVMKQVMSSSKEFVFIAIDETANKKTEALKWNKRWLLVSKLNEDTLCNELCSAIMDCHSKCNTEQFESISQWSAHCTSEINVEDCNEKCNQAKQSVSDILNATKNVLELKRLSFPLHAIWKEWVAIDKERLKPDSEHDKPVALIKEDKISRKKEKRALQLECGLSNGMQNFTHTLQKGEKDYEFLAYFMHYFQQELFQLEEECNKESWKIISEMERQIENLNKVIEQIDRKANEVNSTSQPQKQDFEQRLEECRAMHQHEMEKCKENSIGCEYFLRELGQWYEANTECNVPNNPAIAALPVLAAKLLINGYSLEIMDGDTGRIPLSWVTDVFISLACELGEIPVLVLSVVGVQSSGKSTLLNTMFGVRFPVRAGRCTKGLFLYMLKVDNDYTNKLGAKYVFLLDSEGIRSLERTANFDNELVTLALCISDISILNIEGENLSTEMTGLLEIAAHSLMKMKVVDLPPQCRIVQQRVSDLRARVRNKINMNQILEMLDKATVLAARHEGYENRYNKFSDVFDVQRDKDFWFIPCLWTSPMSPPNELYSYNVTKVKEDILLDVEIKRFVPQLTISTFLQRIRDVWVAVKGENFLFNFRDSVKAVDFNELCKEFNKWVTDMRLSLLQKQFDWQRKTRELSDDHNKFESIVKEISVELDSQKKLVHLLLQSYISEHERDIQRHETLFKQHLESIIAKLARHLVSSIENEKTKTTYQNDITSSVIEIQTKLRKAAKEEASYLQKMKTEDKNITNHDPILIFEAKWEKWTENIRKDFLWPQVSEDSLKATCESLLMSITAEMAISTEIGKLLKDEGGISNHMESAKWEKYYPDKGGVVQVKDWFAHNMRALQETIDSSVSKMEKRSTSNIFDENLFQYILQNALNELSAPHLTSEPPHLLKAKLLLHICANIYVVILKKYRLFEVECSLEKIIEKEKDTIQKDFIAFFKNEDQLVGTIKCLQNNFITIGVSEVRNHLRTGCLNLMVNHGLNNITYVIYTSLKQMFTYDGIEVYISYLKNYYRNHFQAFLDAITSYYSQKTSSKHIMQAQSESFVQVLLRDIRRSIINAKTDVQIDTNEPLTKTKNLYREWLKVLMLELSSLGLLFPVGMEATLATFSVSDLDNFVSELNDTLATNLENKILEEVRIPEPVKGQEFLNFLLESLGNPIGEIMRLTCFQQCPFCCAPCDNPVPVGPTHQHFSFTHVPLGIIGKTQGRKQQLAIDDCTVCVTLPTATYSFDGDKTKRLYKDYKKEFANWDIRPLGDAQPNEATYWKWVFVKYNKALAKHYNCNPAKIPPSWRQITKEDALQSLEWRKRGIKVKLQGTINETVYF